jgi:hypothetical protein
MCSEIYLKLRNVKGHDKKLSIRTEEEHYDFKIPRLKIFLKRQHLSEGKGKQSSSLPRFLSLQWNCWVTDPIRK